MLRVGFAEVDVTPEIGLLIGRFSNQMPAEGVQWPLKVRAAVIESDEGRAAIFALDKNRLLSPAVAEVRQAVSQAADVAADRIMVACSHTHNVPFATCWLPGDESGLAYLDLLKERFAQAAVAAADALQPATWHAASAEVQGLNTNRRRVYQTDRGEQVGTHGPTDIPEFLRLEGPVDRELQVVAALAPDGRCLGGFVNFACHPTTMYSMRVWSSDYIGPLNETLAAEYGDAVFLFLNGAAGNQSPASELRQGLTGADAGPEMARRLGGSLGRHAIAAMASSRPLRDSALLVSQSHVSIPQRRPTGEQIRLARWFIEEAPSREAVDLHDFCRRLYGFDYVMYNPSVGTQEWLCRELLGMWEWQRRVATRELVQDVEVQVIAIGDLAIVGFPAEIFAEFGIEVRDGSPFAATLVAEHANGWYGYLPTVDGFARGGFETAFAYHSKLVPDAGERLRQAASEQLQQLAAAVGDAPE